MEGLPSTGLPCLFFEISPLKVAIRSLGWDHRGPNIYITRSVKRTSKICGRHNKQSQIICGAVNNVLSSSLHYSTQRSCWRTVLIAQVQWWDVLCFSFNICQGGNVDNIQAFSDCLDCIGSHHWTGNQNSCLAGPLGGVKTRAGQHNMVNQGTKHIL